MTLGTILVITGVVLAVFVAVISLAKSAGGKTRGDAVVIVGPIPIIFGSDKHSARVLLIFSIALVGLLIVFFLLQVYF